MKGEIELERVYKEVLEACYEMLHVHLPGGLSKTI
jgi:hypothetical protein